MCREMYFLSFYVTYTKLLFGYIATMTVGRRDGGSGDVVIILKTGSYNYLLSHYYNT